MASGDFIVRNQFPVSGFQPDPDDGEVINADDRTSPNFFHEDDKGDNSRPELLPPPPPPSQTKPRNSSNDVRGLIPSAPDLSELSNEFERCASFAPFASSSHHPYPRTEFEGYDCVVLSNPYVPVAAAPRSVSGCLQLRPVTSRHPLYLVCKAACRSNDIVRACPVCSKPPRIKGYSSCASTKMPISGGYGVFV